MNEVGQGGFSVVYAAQDTQQKNKQVAIKQISLHSLTPRQVIEATDTYNREMGLLSRLKHASLPHIYDHFTGQEYWYLVMDFIKGETLEDYVHKARQGYLPVQEVLDIGIRLCGVLHYLHQQTPLIVFRDVKPANIMRTPRGRLYLIDFGIARHFTPGQRKDTGPLGSPGYAAPKQYGTTQTTAQSDIYSLGATLQTLLTGHDPLDVSPTSGQPIPQKLQQLLDSMLERDASKRPKNMKVVQLQLKLIKQGKKGAVLSYLWGLRYEESVTAYKQAIRLDPDYAEAYRGKGVSLVWLKRYEEALAAYEQAIRLDPTDAKAYYGKGMALENLRRRSEAQQAYARAKQLGYTS
jgi:serine/threonine protein kinase